MSISLTNFKNGFFSLQKLCRNELLQKMVGDLNKAQVDILLKHLDKSSVFQEDSLTSDECSAVPDLFKLMSSYESLNVARKLEILVEIIENLLISSNLALSLTNSLVLILDHIIYFSVEC